jgi:hypothetical protein
MKRWLGLTVVAGLVAAAALVAAHLQASPAAAAKARTGFLLLPREAPAGQVSFFGHIRKLTPRGRGFELRFDPAWFTSGLTARRAKLEDTGSDDVPNDNYVVEEGHRLLSYLLPRSAKVTVLANSGTAGISATPISVDELARIVNGGKHGKLFEPLESGVWIRVRIDTINALDQQYRP